MWMCVLVSRDDGDDGDDIDRQTHKPDIKRQKS